MKYKVVVLAVIFPSNLPYFKAFLSSLESQTFKQFELLLLNDGVANLNEFLEGSSLTISVKPVAGTPASIRSDGLRFLQQEGFNKIIFCDTDDFCSKSRIEQSIEALEKFSLVCSDLDLSDSMLNISAHSYWASRIPEHFIFNQTFLLDKNIAGLGNTAIRSELLHKDWKIDANSLAPDWQLFWQLLEGEEGVFVHNGNVVYRQHNNNSIGIQLLDLQRLDTILTTKINHYNFLARHSENSELTAQLQHTIGIYNATKKAKLDYIGFLNKTSMHYFWWEETNYWV
jgi:hypothetical protein